MAAPTTERASVWSVTYYSRVPMSDLSGQVVDIQHFAAVQRPPGWMLVGQIEQCPSTGRMHFQGMLRTPQVRFSAVKKELGDTVHIEVARDPKALQRYCSKEETRVATVETTSVPNIWQYQNVIVQMWDEKEYQRRWDFAVENHRAVFPEPDDIALEYVDYLVAQDIEKGRRGAEFIAINPMWRSSWKKFWRSIIKRHASQQTQSPPQADEAPAAAQGGDAQ